MRNLLFSTALLLLLLLSACTPATSIQSEPAPGFTLATYRQFAFMEVDTDAEKMGPDFEGHVHFLKQELARQLEQRDGRAGQEPRSQTVVGFYADTGLDEFETHRVRAAAQVLQMRLRDILREQLGGTYSVGVGYSSTSPIPGYGTTTVQFGSSPENDFRCSSRRRSDSPGPGVDDSRQAAAPSDSIQRRKCASKSAL